jgi:hypothetical protein
MNEPVSETGWFADTVLIDGETRTDEGAMGAVTSTVADAVSNS